MSSRRCTIAHVVWSLDVGGLERVVVELVRRLDPDRFESVVVALTHAGALAPDIRDRCRRVAVLGKKPGRAWLLPVRLAALLRRERVDVVHAHNFGPLLYGAGAVRLARTRGLVYTLHGPEASQREDLARIDRIRAIDRVVAVSDHVGAVAVDRGGIAASRITTIYNGIDTETYARVPESARGRLRGEWGIEAGAPVIGTVARLTPEKDHDTLLEAFAQVLKTHPSACLVLAGDGEQREPLEARVRALGIETRVRFLGTRRDVPEVLRALDVFVLPSVIEGLGITLIEAMAAGLPCVATRAGGIPEVAGDDAVLVDSGDADRLTDALRWMLDHPEQAAAMAHTGQARMRERFAIAPMVLEYERLYAALCAPERLGAVR